MKLSDFELTAYDLAVIILPGISCLAEIAIFLKGFLPIWESLEHLSISVAVTLLLISFMLGHLVSQAAYELARLIAGERFYFKSRDLYWQKNQLEIKARLLSKYGVEVSSDDSTPGDKAFNYCLTIIGKSFEKRRVFVLVSALCLSVWFLCLTAFIPASMSTFRTLQGKWTLLYRLAIDAAACGTCAILAWRRMQLYSGLADTTVFQTFMALQTSKELKDASPERQINNDDEG